jgi:hypothetical protein
MVSQGHPRERWPLKWRLAVLGAITALVLVIFTYPLQMRIKVDLPAAGAPLQAKPIHLAPLPKDHVKANGAISPATLGVDGVLVLIALAIAGNMIRLDRKRRREAVETFH